MMNLRLCFAMNQSKSQNKILKDVAHGSGTAHGRKTFLILIP
jgi:hypothetical protein